MYHLYDAQYAFYRSRISTLTIKKFGNGRLQFFCLEYISDVWLPRKRWENTTTLSKTNLLDDLHLTNLTESTVEWNATHPTDGTLEWMCTHLADGTLEWMCTHLTDGTLEWICGFRAVVDTCGVIDTPTWRAPEHIITRFMTVKTIPVMFAMKLKMRWSYSTRWSLSHSLDCRSGSERKIVIRITGSSSY